LRRKIRGRRKKGKIPSRKGSRGGNWRNCRFHYLRKRKSVK